MGVYLRISDDPTEEEKGIARQREDVEALAARLVWTIAKVYTENDTSAYKRRRIRKADGRSVWRVIRPEFRQMLQDYEDGVIDGIIVYDLDRLARQPRDLEDLIDLVDHFKRPVVGVTGALDLMTENGKAMARVLCAMANKSSADTARRVARARLQQAQEGHSQPATRPFGWKGDRIELKEDEARLIRKAALAFTAGETWKGTAELVIDSGIPPVGGGKWYLKTIKGMLLSPRVAGLSSYDGVMRERPTSEGDDADETENADGSVRRTSLRKDAVLRDATGQYVRGTWQPILSVEEWDDLIAEYDRRREGREFTTRNTRKYLLSGLLRCGRPREDGTLCNKTMIGTSDSRHGKVVPIYKCPGPIHGGCGNSTRNMAKLDELIKDLLFDHLEKNRPSEDEQLPESEPENADVARLARVRDDLQRFRDGMRDGTITADSFFAVVPGLEAQEKKLMASISTARRAKADRAQRSRSPEEIRAEWKDATIAGRRSLLGTYLLAVVVHPARTRGRVFDHTTIDPVWKPMAT
ncbi:recombinase family protein [Kitasatospora sp. NPDC101155]|uniref:recombinase family protein n=1 Tax=Kitasatospora sp. NPDC101155 TaxID=3364097 RepID=UPI0038048046